MQTCCCVWSGVDGLCRGWNATCTSSWAVKDRCNKPSLSLCALPSMHPSKCSAACGVLSVPLCPCRRVIMLVQAGAPVDSTIDKLLEYMEPGDIIIDGGNEW